MKLQNASWNWNRSWDTLIADLRKRARSIGDSPARHAADLVASSIVSGNQEEYLLEACERLLDARMLDLHALIVGLAQDLLHVNVDTLSNVLSSALTIFKRLNCLNDWITRLLEAMDGEILATAVKTIWTSDGQLDYLHAIVMAHQSGNGEAETVLQSLQTETMSFLCDWSMESCESVGLWMGMIQKLTPNEIIQLIGTFSTAKTCDPLSLDMDASQAAKRKYIWQSLLASTIQDLDSTKYLFAQYVGLDAFWIGLARGLPSVLSETDLAQFKEWLLEEYSLSMDKSDQAHRIMAIAVALQDEDGLEVWMTRLFSTHPGKKLVMFWKDITHRCNPTLLKVMYRLLSRIPPKEPIPTMTKQCQSRLFKAGFDPNLILKRISGQALIQPTLLETVDKVVNHYIKHGQLDAEFTGQLVFKRKWFTGVFLPSLIRLGTDNTADLQVLQGRKKLLEHFRSEKHITDNQWDEYERSARNSTPVSQDGEGKRWIHHIQTVLKAIQTGVLMELPGHFDALSKLEPYTRQAPLERGLKWNETEGDLAFDVVHASLKLLNAKKNATDWIKLLFERVVCHGSIAVALVYHFNSSFFLQTIKDNTSLCNAASLLLACNIPKVAVEDGRDVGFLSVVLEPWFYGKHDGIDCDLLASRDALVHQVILRAHQQGPRPAANLVRKVVHTYIRASMVPKPAHYLYDASVLEPFCRSLSRDLSTLELQDWATMELSQPTCLDWMDSRQWTSYAHQILSDLYISDYNLGETVEAARVLLELTCPAKGERHDKSQAIMSLVVSFISNADWSNATSHNVEWVQRLLAKTKDWSVFSLIPMDWLFTGGSPWLCLKSLPDLGQRFERWIGGLDATVTSLIAKDICLVLCRAQTRLGCFACLKQVIRRFIPDLHILKPVFTAKCCSVHDEPVGEYVDAIRVRTQVLLDTPAWDWTIDSAKVVIQENVGLASVLVSSRMTTVSIKSFLSVAPDSFSKQMLLEMFAWVDFCTIDVSQHDVRLRFQRLNEAKELSRWIEVFAWLLSNKMTIVHQVFVSMPHQVVTWIIFMLTQPKVMVKAMQSNPMRYLSTLFRGYFVLCEKIGRVMTSEGHILVGVCTHVLKSIYDSMESKLPTSTIGLVSLTQVLSDDERENLVSLVNSGTREKLLHFARVVETYLQAWNGCIEEVICDDVVTSLALMCRQVRIRRVSPERKRVESAMEDVIILE